MEAMTLSGSMFEPKAHDGMKSITGKDGAHHNVYYLDCGANDRPDADVGMRSLRALFPSGEADDYQFAIFSTSGIHGTYTTIEEIEASLTKYGDDGPEDVDGETLGDWTNHLTVLVVQHRIVCLRCGVVRVQRADIEWLKRLRASSWSAAGAIGRHELK